MRELMFWILGGILLVIYGAARRFLRGGYIDKDYIVKSISKSSIFAVVTGFIFFWIIYLLDGVPNGESHIKYIMISAFSSYIVFIIMMLNYIT